MITVVIVISFLINAKHG